MKRFQEWFLSADVCNVEVPKGLEHSSTAPEMQHQPCKWSG